MVGQLYTAESVDADGRSPVLNNSISDVFYYYSGEETWDKEGAAGQSWYTELFLPHDSFAESQLQSDRWVKVDTPEVSTSTFYQGVSGLHLGVEKDEGIVGISSGGKWKLTGDFDIRLYIDWNSYYNEYRSVTHTFLKVGVDNSNAVRVSLVFDGTGFALSSEKTVGRNLVYFDWKDTDDPQPLSAFSDVAQYKYLKIKRVGGIVSTYFSTGAVDTLVGDYVSDSVFSGDVVVEAGVESKEYNTCRSVITKFMVFSGSLETTTEFFSSVRGRRQSFPERAVVSVDASSVSIIDEDSNKLWARVLLSTGFSVPGPAPRVYACNGVVYCTTPAGLVALDFHRDKIYRYRDSEVQVADEPLAMRNTLLTYRSFMLSFGDIPDNNIHAVTCRTLAGYDHIAFTHDAGITVVRALSSGVANCLDGPLPGAAVHISESGALYWVGHTPADNDGELSYRTGVASVVVPGTSSFSRTGYYGVDTTPSIFGSAISCFDVRVLSGHDLLAVGTSEGISFIGLGPGVPLQGTTSYGAIAVATNPIDGPSFEDYLGVYWKVSYTGLHRKFSASREASFSGTGVYSLKLKLDTLSADQYYTSGTTGSVFQDVDLTGVPVLYFDCKMPFLSGSGSSTNAWVFEILVGTTVVKSYQDIGGPFTKLADSVDLSGYTGVHRVTLRIRVVADTSVLFMGNRYVQVGNLRTKIGTPDFRVLPLGGTSVIGVLLQYDSAGHKVYYTSSSGYGAIDLDTDSLEYFLPADTYVPGADVLSTEFYREEDD